MSELYPYTSEDKCDIEELKALAHKYNNSNTEAWSDEAVGYSHQVMFMLDDIIKQLEGGKEKDDSSN